MRARWLGLAWGLGLFIAVSLKGEAMDAVVAFLVAIPICFCLDFLGIKVLGFWRYPRQPFLGKQYFGLIVPCYGVFGMMVNLTWNQVPWVGWLTFLALTCALFLLIEVPNLKIKSWVYTVPMWLVFIGWFPLVYFMRLLFVVVR